MKPVQPSIRGPGTLHRKQVMMLTGKMGTLILVLGLDGDNFTTTGGSRSTDKAEQNANARTKRIDIVVSLML